MTTRREPCWPVFIYGPDDWDHSHGAFRYIRFTEIARLEQIFAALHDAGFEIDATIGLYGQETADERVPASIARVVEAALDGYLTLPENLAPLAGVLSGHGLTLRGRHVRDA